MKRALLLCAIVLIGCGGESSNTLTSPTPIVSAPSVNIVGSWAGTFTAAGTIVQTGERATTTCNHIWAITNQTGGQFSGTWQSSGGTCAQAGTISGTVSASGVLGNVTLSVSSGTTPPLANGVSCTQSGSQTFNGIASVTAITLSANDRLRCSGLGLVADVDRAITLAMTKR